MKPGLAWVIRGLVSVTRPVVHDIVPAINFQIDSVLTFDSGQNRYFTFYVEWYGNMLRDALDAEL